MKARVNDEIRADLDGNPTITHLYPHLRGFDDLHANDIEREDGNNLNERLYGVQSRVEWVYPEDSKGPRHELGAMTGDSSQTDQTNRFDDPVSMEVLVLLDQE